MQHIGNTLAAPQAGVGAGIGHRQPRIGGRGRNSLCVQLGCNLTAAHPVQRHAEDPPHHGSHFLVDDDFVFLGGVHLVAIDRLPADELSLPLLIPLDALDLLGDILGIHVVHNGPEGCDVVGAGLHAGVDSVQQGNVPHPFFREVPLHVVTGHDVVAAQTGQVFGDDHVDLLGLNVRNHPLECRTVKICAAETVINIDIVDR